MTPDSTPQAGNYCKDCRKGGIESSTVSGKPCDVCGAVPSKSGFPKEAQATLEKVRELVELEKNISSGKWIAFVPDSSSEQLKDNVARFPYDRHQEESLKVLVRSEHCKEHAIVDCSLNHTCVELLEQEDNAVFIASVRNAFPSIASLVEAQAKEIETLRGALDILKRGVVLALRRANRGLRTQANPLTDLKAVVESLPPIETLTGMTPLCDRCDLACFKDCSQFCDIVLCEKCASIPPSLGANSPPSHE